MAIKLPSNNPQGVIQYIRGTPSATPDEYRSIRQQQPDINSIFDAFTREKNITTAKIETYLEELEGTPNTFDAHLIALVAAMNGPSSPGKIEAEYDLIALANYMNKRNVVIQQSIEKQNELNDTITGSGMSPDQLPAVDPLDVMGKVQTGFGGLISGFQNAENGKDKAIVIGGAAVGVLLLAKILSTRTMRNTVGVPLGLYALWGTYQAMNRSAALTTGKTFYGQFNNLDSTDKASYKQQLEKAIKELGASNIDDKFIEQMLGPKNKRDIKYVKGITNFGSLTVERFLKIYEDSKQKGRVEDNVWPKRPAVDSEKFHEYNLTSNERFVFMKKMAEALNLVDAAGNEIPVPDEQMEEKILYRILNRPI